LGPTSVMDDDSMTPVIDNVLSEDNSSKYISLPLLQCPQPLTINSISLTDINQTAQPGPNVPWAQSKFK
ncbi:hypothetical protein H0H87_005354, partial [Tephrocybe sp. NHM501043]